MRPSHLQTGDQGEDLAASYLSELGWILLERNYRFEKAELDLIFLDGQELVFVEVKTRTGIKDHTYPEGAVTPAKQRLCIRAADAFVYEKKMWTVPARFDVVAIRLQEGESPEIIHFRDAFRGDDSVQSDIGFWDSQS
jgi:putative endonuclease